MTPSQNTPLSESTIQKMIEMAIAGRNHAYVPYSKFSVGASVLCDSGKIYSGCNISNASYPVGLCAERVAVAKAISEGESIIAVCVVAEKQVFPCGMCRQFMYEFCKNAPVVIADIAKQYQLTTLSDLLPKGFGPESLEKSHDR